MVMKISVDEMKSRRKDLQSGTVTVVRASAPPSWDKDKRSARYIMNAQEVDRYGDIVVTAGIDTTEFDKNPVALLFHNSRSWPVGSWSDVSKITKGKPPRLEGTLNFLPQGGPVKEVDEAAWMVANGGIRACSIGFMPDWEEAEAILDDNGQWTGGVKFNKSSLLECSICAIGASPSSLVKDASSPQVAKELLEMVLDNWAKTPDGLIIPRKEYEAAYRTVSAEKTVVEVAKDDMGGTEEQDMPTEEEGMKPGECATPDAQEDDPSQADKDAGPEEGDEPSDMDDEAKQQGPDECEPDGCEPLEAGKSAPNSITVDVAVDTSEALKAVSELTTEIQEVEKQATSLIARLKDLFGFSKTAPAPDVRVEPTIETPAPPVPEISQDEKEAILRDARNIVARHYASR